MSGEDKFDVVIVGAGPAGVAAAIQLARAGLDVVIIERGAFPGAKNISGGILYTSFLEKLIPGFRDEAPWERAVKTRRISVLGESAECTFSYSSEKFSKSPYNHSFTVLRSKFDKWFAEQAESAGAVLLCDTLVTSLIMENGIVSGVKTGRPDGDIYARCVIVAEGCNSLLARQAGLRKREFTPAEMINSAKEVIQLAPETIAERFQLRERQGAALVYLGRATGGLLGSGFLYTNYDSISIGVGVLVDSLAREKRTLHGILESFKQHPSVAPLISGGDTIEYSGHMIPEGGENTLSRYHLDGALFVGDAAGFINSNPVYQEGTNLAMASGGLAAEVILEAKTAGDFSSKTLCRYDEKIKESFVFKDMRQHSGMVEFGLRYPEFFGAVPDISLNFLHDYFTVNDMPKKELQKIARKRFLKELPKWKVLKGLWEAKRYF